MPNSFAPIVTTRLAPPQGTRLVHRDRLLAWLEAERERKLILLIGPAGCGKTSLATLWRKILVTQGNSVVWFNQSADDDIAQFAAYLVAGLETLEPGIAHEAKTTANRFGMNSFDPFIAAVVNGLHQYARPVYLVLEDIHEVAATPICQLVEKLVAWAPPNLHVVITSRTAQPFSLAELRARDQVAELDFRSLRFDLAETELFLQSLGVDQLDLAMVREMHRDTDGWAAGLQLIAYSIRKAKNIPRELQTLAAKSAPRSSDYIGEYFEQIVSSSLSAEEQAFLVRASSCRRFNRELCELITANPRSSELLAKFEAENLFIVPIESNDAEPWYRFHRLFAKYLNDRLCRLQEDELTSINIAAGRWFAGKGLYTEAIRHSRYAGDMKLCVELVERVARPMVQSGEFLLVREWIRRLPREALLERSELLICAVWAELGCGKLDDARWMLASIDAHIGVTDSAMHHEYVLLRAWYFIRQDDTTAALQILSPYESSLPSTDPLVAFGIRNVLAVALIHSGQFERARDTLKQAGRTIAADLHTITPIVAHGIIALSFLKEGAFRQAGDVMKKIFEEIEAERIARAESTGLTSGFAIAAAYAQNELMEAESLLHEYVQLIDTAGLPDCIIEAHLVQVRLLRAEARFDDALCTLDQADVLAGQLGIDRLHACALAERVEIEIERGNRPAAREVLRQLQHLAQEYRNHVGCAWAEIPFVTIFAEGNMAAADGNFDQALALYQSLIEICDTQGRLAQTVKLLLRRAIVLSAQHKNEIALETLRQTLSIAAPHRMLRIFLDERLPAIHLLEQLVSHSTLVPEESAFVQEVLKAGARWQHIAQSNAAPQAQDTVRLSPRELEILELISHAYSNKSIARALNCSDVTVKWHVKNIFQKLGAFSREDAAIKARNLNLLR